MNICFMMFFLAKEVQQVDGNLGFVGLFVSFRMWGCVMFKGVVELKFERKQECNERARSLKVDQSDQSKS